MRIQLIVTVIAGVLCIIFRQPSIMCYILGAALIINLIITYSVHTKREKSINELISYLMKVQDKLELPALHSIDEGNFGILQSEIYKLVIQLKEQYNGEMKQKRYMVDMLSDISHQIKTPITAISLMIELLSVPELSDEKRMEYVEKINHQTNRITWLIKNLLTLSQLEVDMLELKKERVQLHSILNALYNTFEIMAEVKGVNLSFNCPDDVYIVCDKHWMGEAISNIVKNCIEHTNEGGSVKINAIQNNIATEIIISDTGVGIAKEHLSNIFKRFYKAPGSSNNSVGIGLSMSKQIIMRQNGTVSAESEIGVGSRFIIKLYR